VDAGQGRDLSDAAATRSLTLAGFEGTKMAFDNSDLEHRYSKPLPSTLAIFGASGRLGKPMAAYLSYHSPDIQLRLITSNPAKAAALASDFPQAEVAVASYFDPAGLVTALDGADAAFVVTPTGMDEAAAMGNLVKAVATCGTMTHMIRVTGIQPDTNNARIPQFLKEFGRGLEVQHPIARKVLDEAEMPVTYFNIGASFMDNFLNLAPAIQRGTIPWPDRSIPYVDPRDVAEAAARLMLSRDARHIYQFYTLNNGEARMSMTDVASVFENVLLRPVVSKSARADVDAYFGPLIAAGRVPPFIPDYLWHFMQYEAANEHVWVPNLFLQSILGRQPNTLRSWVMEHRHRFEPPAANQQ
jgi:uncharacterized protein YbjT (DUF2867 family)